MTENITSPPGAAMITAEIATFAARFSISPTVAYTLPAIFDRVASVAGQSVRQTVADATYHNNELGFYISRLAHKVHADIMKSEVPAWLT